MTSGGTISETSKIDERKLNDFMGKVVNDLGATSSTVLVIIGDKLGLYKAMADSKPISSEELARRTGTSERYIREWLANQAASGYISYDPNTEKYTLPPEQAMALANENSPVFSLGVFKVQWHFSGMNLKLQKHLDQEKELTGVIMITICMKVLKDFSNQIMLLI